MLALLVGLIEIGLGLEPARVRRRSAVERGPGRLHERSAITIIVGQLPKLCGFSTGATSFRARLPRGSSTSTRPRPPHSSSASRCPRAPRAPRFTKVIRRCSSRWWVRPSCRPPRAVGHDRDCGHAAQRLPEADVPWTSVGDVVPLFVAAVGITLVSLTDTIATSAAFAARRATTSTRIRR